MMAAALLAWNLGSKKGQESPFSSDSHASREYDECINEVQMRIESMRELLKNMVDVQKLKQSEELSTSIQDEAKRQSIDAAKKRAAAQNVDYPCFANLVSCAHLKPMTRKELDTTTVRKPRQDGSIPAWSFDVAGHRHPDISNMATCRQVQHDLTKNRVTNTDVTRDEVLLPNTGFNLSYFENPLFTDDEPSNATHGESGSANSSLATSYVPIPRQRWNDRTKLLGVKAPTAGPQGLSYSSDLFIKEWKLLNTSRPSERLRFLSEFLPSSLPVLFRVEIPPFLLAEILEILRSTALNLSRGPGKENENGGALFPVNKKDINQKQTGNCVNRAVCEKQAIELRTVTSASNLTISNQPGLENLEQQLVPKLTRPVGTVGDSEKLVHWVASVMDVLRSCGRFGLAVKLIGQESRHTAREILNHIARAITDPNMFSALTNGAGPSDLLQSYGCT